MTKSTLQTSPFVLLWKLIVEVWVDICIRKIVSAREISIQANRPIPQGKAEGANHSTDRHNNTALAYERYFLQLLSNGLVLLVIFASIKL